MSRMDKKADTTGASKRREEEGKIPLPEKIRKEEQHLFIPSCIFHVFLLLERSHHPGEKVLPLGDDFSHGGALLRSATQDAAHEELLHFIADGIGIGVSIADNHLPGHVSYTHCRIRLSAVTVDFPDHNPVGPDVGLLGEAGRTKHLRGQPSDGDTGVRLHLEAGSLSGQAEVGNLNVIIAIEAIPSGYVPMKDVVPMDVVQAPGRLDHHFRQLLRGLFHFLEVRVQGALAANFHQHHQRLLKRGHTIEPETAVRRKARE